MTKKLILLLLFLSLGLNIYLFLLFRSEKSILPSNNTSTSKLINPNVINSVDSNVLPSNLILHYTGLTPKINEALTTTGVSSTSAGIFLQDIKTGAWFGLNEREPFIPASLLKVPLLMATLKRVERDETKLTDTLELTSEDLDNNAGDLYKRGAGAKLTIWELLKLMILTSDNTAKNAIKRHLLPVEINAVFAHIGIPNPYVSLDAESVTPRGYSRIFKSLYFSSFLSPELSEKALDLTTDTQVENLISAGVPPEIQIAHKYGERPDGLSDCGIIYHPKHPYFLCIMVKDEDVSKAKKLISLLSREIYVFISKK